MRLTVRFISVFFFLFVIELAYTITVRFKSNNLWVKFNVNKSIDLTLRNFYTVPHFQMFKGKWTHRILRVIKVDFFFRAVPALLDVFYLLSLKYEKGLLECNQRSLEDVSWTGRSTQPLIECSLLC